MIPNVKFFSQNLVALALGLSALSVAACDDSTPTSDADAGDEPGADASVEPDADGGEPEPAKGPLVIVTEREGPEGPMKYLHVVEDWPRNGKLDESDAIELGAEVVAHAQDSAVFVYEYEGSVMQKYEVGEDLTVKRGAKISFAHLGITGYDPDLIWAAPDRAYLVDEATGQVVTWNPRKMSIGGSKPIAESVLKNEGINAQLQERGVVSGGRAFLSVNWHNWDTYDFVTGVALAYFDAESDSPETKLLHDSDGRCVPSVASPFVDAEGNVYVMGDGALGFQVMASPKKSSLPQCVMRVKKGETEFDPDFYVDVQAATGSPAFRSAYFMPGNKLLVNLWAPDVKPEDVVDTSSSGWYWELPPYFEWAIVDLEKGTAQKVDDLPRGAAQFSGELKVDDINYVQIYDEAKSATIYRVDPDGTVTEVLEPGTAADVQYLGRL